MVLKAPVIQTINHASKRTMDVRRAVARFELVFFNPHFDRIVVIPAKRAEKIAATTHIISPPFKFYLSKMMASYGLKVTFEIEQTLSL